MLGKLSSYFLSKKFFRTSFNKGDLLVYCLNSIIYCFTIEQVTNRTSLIFKSILPSGVSIELYTLIKLKSQINNLYLRQMYVIGINDQINELDCRNKWIALCKLLNIHVIYKSFQEISYFCVDKAIAEKTISIIISLEIITIFTRNFKENDQNLSDWICNKSISLKSLFLIEDIDLSNESLLEETSQFTLLSIENILFKSIRKLISLIKSELKLMDVSIDIFIDEKFRFVRFKNLIKVTKLPLNIVFLNTNSINEQFSKYYSFIKKEHNFQKNKGIYKIPLF